MTVDLKELATSVVQRAMKGGAHAAECVVREGDEFSTVVRMGQVETLKESGGRSMGLRVFYDVINGNALRGSGALGRSAASTYTSDFSKEGLEQLISGALTLAKLMDSDPYAGLPEKGQFGQVEGDLGLYYDDVYSLPTEERIAQARRAEQAAMSADKRISNSEGGSFDAATGRKVLANSLGFVGEYQRSYCSLSAVPIAQDSEGGSMQRDFWYSVARTLAKLDSPEHVGKVAAERTVRRLGARKVPTARVPVVFEPMVARALVENIFEAVNGDAIYRGASFLAGKLGEQVAGDNVNVVDDGAMPGGFGTSPFDGEGVPTRRTVVIDRGVLKSYLLNTYTARKLGMATTGNAARGLAGNPGIGVGNFFLQPGTKAPQEIIGEIADGLYVTEFLGFGVNLVTGDFSRGASGLWIRNGELAFPVEEITVAGNLRDMIRSITAIGSDLEFRGAVASPTIRIDGLTVAGE